MTFQFNPIDDDSQENDLKVPYFENARADFAPYYAQHDWTVPKAKKAIETVFERLGANVLRYREGDFTIAGQVRRGYQIEFSWKGARGRIMVAGLPIEKQVTEAKLNRIKIQGLLNVRDWIKAAITARIFSPGEHPLIAHLVMKSGKTMAEQLAETMHLPQLPGGDYDFIEGEFTEA